MNLLTEFLHDGGGGNDRKASFAVENPLHLQRTTFLTYLTIFDLSCTKFQHFYKVHHYMYFNVRTIQKLSIIIYLQTVLALNSVFDRE